MKSKRIDEIEGQKGTMENRKHIEKETLYEIRADVIFPCMQIQRLCWQVFFF